MYKWSRCQAIFTMVLKLQARGVISSWVADFLKFMKLYKLLGFNPKKKENTQSTPKVQARKYVVEFNFPKLSKIWSTFE
jgi:hypothetical protein